MSLFSRKPKREPATLATKNQIQFIENLLMQLGGGPEDIEKIEINGRTYKSIYDFSKMDASAFIDRLIKMKDK